MSVVFEKPVSPAFLSRSDVLANSLEAGFQMSDATLRRLVKKNLFPAPLSIGGRRYWEVAAIEQWKAQRIQEARAASVASAAQE